ncbi:MAG: type II toxin-antitoxin system VapC family toxin [Pseudonocardiaceae bacterium]
MPEYVVDAAAAVSALGRKDAIGIAAHKLIAEATCHAPHLLDAEVGHVLRRGERAGEISEQTTRTALHALPEMIDHRYPHTGRLAARAWDLRHTITFYNALYVALAARALSCLRYDRLRLLGVLAQTRRIDAPAGDRAQSL